MSCIDLTAALVCALVLSGFLAKRYALRMTADRMTAVIVTPMILFI
jgi:hypothetical protein